MKSKKKEKIEGQGRKQIDAFKDLKPKKQTKPIEDKSNNQSKTAIMFNDLIHKRKKILGELHDGVD